MGYLNKVINFIALKEVYNVIFTVLVGIIIYNFISMILGKIIIYGKTEYDRKKRTTIVKLFRNIVKYFIIISVSLFILNLYGYNVKTLLAGLGIAATVLGLALQDTIKDFIGGITIIMENYYVAGDIIRYNDFTGEVIDMTLKSTKIKSFEGEVLIIANRNVSEVVNLSQKIANLMITIPVSYETDIDKVEKMIKEQLLDECKNIKDVDETKIKYLGIDKLNDSSISYLICIGCKQESRWQVKRDALHTILKVMKKNNISVPYNKIEVINAKD